MQLNKILEYVAYAVGGLALFLASLLVFALAAGVPAHEVAIVGGFFPEPEKPTMPEVVDRDPDAAPARPKLQPKTMEEVVQGVISRLPTQAQVSPFEQNELQDLVTDVKRLKLQYERDIEEIELREQEVDDRQLALDERQTLLEEFTRELDAREAEIALKQAELRRDEKAAAEALDEKWKTVARAFAEGEPEALKAKLLAYDPEEGARILFNLEEERRNELLGVLEAAEFKEYNDAFSALSM